MMIPKQDIMAGLPIRWAFHIWKTGGQWKFAEWRDYLLEMEQWDCSDCIATKKILKMLRNGQQKLDILHFLDWHKASSLIGFIHWYQNQLKEYEQLLKSEGVI